VPIGDTPMVKYDPSAAREPRPDLRASFVAKFGLLAVGPAAAGPDEGVAVLVLNQPQRLCLMMGAAKSVMRAQAVPPTIIAPIIAKASRQPSEGTPMWARPRVA
jgi:hypothetical protein